ncbi:ComEC/Rec2 family competence protein [Sphaerobacter thermophilus]|jgi:competence protein ComEC|uniref:Beta-lactamase domain protein n=1 Tax=Sphaerobacter thermophilus (strain ATCC 49802 / DSM 20745 / KCCM 41009 / NCIMB 13125 / S 6022) TaxID=479434 RepID=D1C6V8_SPHTD|nr:ComEC/Rec2 family competence protein [Sphaerobacter thermophilus]ACZ37719.1 beta-lactamase domain protein [Sphaerobacter thermophilus DSM 20745]
MNRRASRRLRWVILALALVLLLVILALALPSLIGDESGGREPGELTRIAFFDVGQGLSVGIITADGRSLLYDMGDREDAVDSVILSFFREHGIERLDYVVSSHPDQDHIGELATVLRRIPVGTYLDPAIENTNRAYLRGLQVVEEKGIPAQRARRGDAFELGERTRVEVLWPEPPFITDSDGEVHDNNNSVVLRVIDGDVRILLTGDIEEEAEEELLALDPSALRADLLQVAHHGSNSSSTMPFLDAVGARTAVISAGADNSYGHPHRETMQRLREAGMTVYRTDVDGTVVFVSDGTQIQLEGQEGTP